MTESGDAAVRIRSELRPGDIGMVIYLHGTLYAKEQGWDHTFEAYVAGPLGEFARSPARRSRLWIVERESEKTADRGGQVAGSIAIVEASATEAQLRWYLLHPDLRGRGIGRRLLEGAISFCRGEGYESVFLWTVSALTAAATLYRAAGFHLTEEQEQRLWGATVIEQRYELRL